MKQKYTLKQQWTRITSFNRGGLSYKAADEGTCRAGLGNEQTWQNKLCG